jgi:hypothetical protein
VTLAPGERARYERRLVVATRGDTLAVAAELDLLRGGSPGGVDVHLADARGEPVPLPEGALVRVSPVGAPADPALPLWLRVTRDTAIAPDRVGGELPAGRYELRLDGAGRQAIAPVLVDVRAGEIAHASLALSEPARLRVEVRERVAGGAPVASPAKVQVLEAATGRRVGEPLRLRDGRGEVAVEPGRYRVVASRGPERSLAEATVDVAAGEPAAPIVLELARVVDTSGWVACDVGSHVPRAGDAAALAERVLSSLVEGVECVVPAEREAAAGLAEAVRALGIGASLRVLEAGELVSTRRLDAAAPPGARSAALAVWTGRSEPTARALDDLFARLRASQPVTPVAGTDPDGVLGDVAGSARTYVAVPDDDPAHLDAAALERGLAARRDVVLTNGPFVTARLGGVRQGGLFRWPRAARGSQPSLEIVVERAPWIDASELVVIVGGTAAAPIPLARWTATRAGGLRASLSVPLRLAAGPAGAPADTFVLVEVRGRAPLDPGAGPAAPFAMTSPIWIDADGDGACLGR